MKKFLPLAALAAALIISPAVAAASPAAPAAAPPHGVRVHGGLHYQPGVRLPATHLPRPSVIAREPLSTTMYESDNWSGYAALNASGVKLTSVSAEFTVPSLNCATSSPGADGAWVTEWAGLDGFTSSTRTSDTVEQEGVDAYCETTSSTPVYYAWYEMYPLAQVAFTGNINPGDAISVSTGRYKSGNSYLLALTDLTTGAGFSTEQACPTGSSCLASSAEVIMEAPYEDGTLPLADYGAMTFGNATVEANFTGTEKGTLAAGKHWSTAEIEMVSTADAPESVPGALYGGSDFSLTWKSS